VSKKQGWNFELMLTKADFGWNIMFLQCWCSREVYISLLVFGKNIQMRQNAMDLQPAV